MRNVLLAVVILTLLSGCAQRSTQMPLLGQQSIVDTNARLPEVPREARGVWVATVANIDWPSKPGLPVEQQKAELIAIMDEAAALNLNVIIFQVRTACDALYASELEPWSAYLSGEQGAPPDPYYDPLAMAIEEAHARGMELHAWYNPFRARHPSTKALAANHVGNTHPDWVKKYGQFLWLDPGVPEAREHSLAVVRDIVKRYDVDGMHVDDYFYPYPINGEDGQRIPFPDDDSWAVYQENGGTLSRDDWRRDNINQFMQAAYDAVKAEKPYVKVGVSPFGIWRPGHPEQIEGFDAVNGLYADSRVWLQEGWLDYLTPQLYWAIDPPAQSYPVLMHWWAGENTMERGLWPGNFIGRVEGRRGQWEANEISRQIHLTRAEVGAEGNVHFSMKTLMLNSGGLTDSMQQLYATPALVPAMPWLDEEPPPAPQARVQRGSRGMLKVAIEPGAGEAATHWVVQARYGRQWRLWIVPARHDAVEVPAACASAPAEFIAVRAVDRCGNLSDAAVVGGSKEARD